MPKQITCVLGGCMRLRMAIASTLDGSLLPGIEAPPPPDRSVCKPGECRECISLSLIVPRRVRVAQEARSRCVVPLSEFANDGREARTLLLAAGSAKLRHAGDQLLAEAYCVAEYRDKKDGAWWPGVDPVDVSTANADVRLAPGRCVSPTLKGDR